MSPGDLLLKASFAASVASAALYLPALRGKQTRAAAWPFVAHAALLVAAASLLWFYFVAHRFDIAYVAQYSSRALSPSLALAASWAGQEGSILLWVSLGALIGVALLVQPGVLKAPAMFFVSLSQALMISLLLKKSPFDPSAVIPGDGQGLNPLLEDPWMVAHPPALFVGYAALLIPFALAAAALVRGEYREWNRMVWPWALFAVVSLGTGIVLGGIWAYKVLGWGGYWGWDPVENASLVPWLAAVALLHGLLIQRTTGAVTRTSLLLALLAWVTVLGGTYLTRSGALQNFSVHSFTDLGLGLPLAVMLLTTTLIGAVLLALRWRSIANPTANWLSVSRESALWLGMVTVIVLMTLVTFGTAAPLITGLAGSPASVQARFYQDISVPLGIALVILMGISPALRWSKQRGTSWLSTLAPGLVGGALAAGIAMFAGVKPASHVALLALSAFALTVNGVVTVQHFRRGWAYGAGYLGHVGIAVLVLGMVLSASLGKTERVRLPRGEAVSALGYSLTFQGEEQGTRGQQVLRIDVRKPGFELAARPRLFPSPQGDGMIREPALAKRGELYLSPMDVVPGEFRMSEPTWLPKGREVSVDGVGYTFSGFRMKAEKELMVFADIQVRRDGKITTVSPAMRAGALGSQPVAVALEGAGTISLSRIDADGHRVAVTLPNATVAQPVAIVDFSTKPLINLVWLGALLAVLGAALAGIRRAAEPMRAARSVAAAGGLGSAEAG